MTRRTYWWNPETREFQEVPNQPRRVRSHQVIEDTMPLTWHPLDGRHYDSKSKFREVTRAHGGEEVGNDPHFDKPMERTVDYGDIKADIAHAIDTTK